MGNQQKPRGQSPKAAAQWEQAKRLILVIVILWAAVIVTAIGHLGG